MKDDTIQAEDYPVVMTRQGDDHVVQIRELFLVERDKDLSVGLERLSKRAEILIAEQATLGTLDDLTPPGGVAQENDDKRALKKFAFKSSLVALVAVIVVAAASASFSYAVREPLIKRAVKLAMEVVEMKIAQTAATGLTPERREMLRIKVAEAVPHLKPFAVELRPLFAQFCSSGQ